MHGGGTSKYPHCRPFGTYNSEEDAYKVRLLWVPDKDMKTKVLVDMFVVRSATGGEPTQQETYPALIAKVDAMLELRRTFFSCHNNVR